MCFLHAQLWNCSVPRPGPTLLSGSHQISWPSLASRPRSNLDPSRSQSRLAFCPGLAFGVLRNPPPPRRAQRGNFRILPSPPRDGDQLWQAALFAACSGSARFPQSRQLFREVPWDRPLEGEVRALAASPAWSLQPRLPPALALRLAMSLLWLRPPRTSVLHPAARVAAPAHSIPAAASVAAAAARWWLWPPNLWLRPQIRSSRPVLRCQLSCGAFGCPGG